MKHALVFLLPGIALCAESKFTVTLEGDVPERQQHAVLVVKETGRYSLTPEARKEREKEQEQQEEERKKQLQKKKEEEQKKLSEPPKNNVNNENAFSPPAPFGSLGGRRRPSR